jgi:hypothetical protein
MFGDVDQKSFKKVWMEAIIFFFLQLFEILMEHCDVMDLELMVVVAQKIWFRRNGVVYEGEFTPPQQLFCEANTSLDDYRRVTTTDLATKSAIHKTSL